MKKTVNVETVADAYMELLAARGVKYFFGNGGSDFGGIVEAYARRMHFEEQVPTPITCPHEIPLVAMAHGYTMVTGEPQVAMVHTIAGTANSTGGLINAARNGVPMIFTAGRTPLTEGNMRGARGGLIHWGQDTFDQGGMLREWVKWDYELRHGADLEGTVDRALAISNSYPRGPVYLVLPNEILAEDQETLTYGTEPRMSPTDTVPSSRTIEDAAALIARARNPILITRAGGRDPAAVSHLVRLCEAVSMPVFESIVPSHMNFPRGHRLYQGVEAGQNVNEADVIVVLENDAPWSPRRNQPAPDARVISIAEDPLYERYPVRSFQSDLNLAGNVAETLRTLADAVYALPRPADVEARAAAWGVKHDEVIEGRKQRALAAREKRPLDKAWVSYCLEQVRDEETILVNELGLDMGQLAFDKPGSLFDVSPAGVLGWGLGAALGAKLAAPEKTVIACTGDGSYMYGVPTASHWIGTKYDLPVLYLVWNNVQLGAVAGTARGLFPNGWAAKTNPTILSDLSPSVRFEQVVEACDGYGQRVEDPAEVPAALERALYAVRVERRQALINFVSAPMTGPRNG
jgi:acetolactate synthase-1/2/3 large subunit